MKPPAMIAFKSFELMTQMQAMHPNVIAVLHWMAERVWPEFGERFMVVTAGFYEGGSGVHADYRAVDVRSKRWASDEPFDYHVARAIEDLINAAWDHGSGGRFKVCYYHIAAGSDQPGWHFHIQVRDATKLRSTDVVDD